MSPMHSITLNHMASRQ
uniref:Uncharacterized protein n=1 Tax=Rhizophora mucronata TaxID=61149 RepID=A0A2P2ND96_RHIMU